MFLAQIKHKNKIYQSVFQNNKFHIIKGSFYESFVLSEDFVDEKDVEILQPCNPSKIVAIGLNYKKHAKEMGFEIPRDPVVFLKPQSSLIGPNQSIVYPANVGRLDYEAELAIVIRKTAKNLSKIQVEEDGYILGYTCANDVTARDLQKPGEQWTICKGFDTFCPIGPFISTGLDPRNLEISLKLNGEIKQKSNTQDMIFDVFEIVEFVSKIMTLFPGDVILAGTPENIGPMQKGDCVEVEIEKIGILKNFVK